MMNQSMDRELSSEFLKKRKLKLILVTSSVIAGLVIAFFALRTFIKPGIERSKIIIATADTGTLEATIAASGVVIPENEFLITSPINAKIQKVLLRAGEAVKAGESILQLDKQSTLMAYDKLLDDQEVSRNKINQLKLSLERSLNDLQTQYSIKQMRIKSLETDLEHEQSLLKIGGGTPERVKQAGVNLDIAKLELQQLKNQISNQEKTNQADLKSLGFEISIKGKGIAETGNKLSQAEVRSPANGIITWVSDQIGAEIAEGAEIAKVADLSSYKVEGSISDTYASQLKTGGTVIVRINDTDLRGKITNIQPAVENGNVKFMISLDQRNNPLLRSNLKADVFIVSSVKDNVVRVKNGPAFNGSVKQKIFVMSNQEAVAREITVGESNFDYIEIRSGLKPGDQVIISDMKDYEGMERLHVGK